MSLILDALRRADRERELDRGAVPSLYSPAPPPWTPPGEPVAPAGPRPWVWLAAGVGGGLVLAAAWALWSATPGAPAGASVEPPPIPAAPVAKAPAEVAPAAAPAPAPAAPAKVEPIERREPAASPVSKPPDVRREPPPVATTERAPAPKTADERTPSPPVARQPAAVAERRSPRRDEPEPARAAAPRRDEPRAEAAAVPAPERSAAAPIRQIGELPADVRSQLPALTIGGAMYSSKPSSRRLIVNGQLLSEGEQVAPGLVLEEIRLKSAVLRWRDVRYEQGF